MRVSHPFRLIFRFVALAFLIGLAACATPRQSTGTGAGDSPHFKIGKPYKINGKWYHPKEEPDYNKVGTASWYGKQFHGRKTANGEIFDMNRMTAAHTTLPMPSMVEVKNLENGRKVVVRVNDRGPFAHNRIIDMSREAARRLGFEKNGLAKVRVRYLGPAGLPGDQPRQIRRRGSPPAERPPPVSAPPDGIPQPSPDGIEGLLEELDTMPEAAPSALDIAPAIEPTVFLIRVITIASLNNVERVRASLSHIGPMRLAQVETDTGDVFYRINMGPFTDPNEAARRLDAVREAGYGDASIVAINP